MVEEKIGWMVCYLFGLESLAYLTTGMIDEGIEDYSVESAIAKISGTEFVWYQANRALQLAGGLGYMRDQPYEQILRDIRIFPIFEGANDVMRSFVALSALKPLGEELAGVGDLGLGDPIGSIGALAEYAFGRVKREIRPERVTRAHERAVRPRRLGRRPGQAPARRGRGAAAQVRQGHRRSGARAQALLRRAQRHLRADRRALARDARSSRSRASRHPARSASSPRRSAGARARGSRARSTEPRSTTTTTACTRSRRSRTSAAPTATRCSRTGA